MKERRGVFKPRTPGEASQTDEHQVAVVKLIKWQTDCTDRRGDSPQCSKGKIQGGAGANIFIKSTPVAHSHSHTHCGILLPKAQEAQTVTGVWWNYSLTGSLIPCPTTLSWTVQVVTPDGRDRFQLPPWPWTEKRPLEIKQRSSSGRGTEMSQTQWSLFL